MLIEYMETTEGSWPSNWEELAAPYEVVANRGEDYCTFEEVRQCVEIDFSFDPARIMKNGPKSDAPPIKVIRLKRTPAGWTFGEPNARITDYLRRRESKRGRS